MRNGQDCDWGIMHCNQVKATVQSHVFDTILVLMLRNNQGDGIGIIACTKDNTIMITECTGWQRFQIAMDICVQLLPSTCKISCSLRFDALKTDLVSGISLAFGTAGPELHTTHSEDQYHKITGVCCPLPVPCPCAPVIA